jgi:hypothetical protein
VREGAETWVASWPLMVMMEECEVPAIEGDPPDIDVSFSSIR